MKDLARKIDSMRQFGYVLLTQKEAKRVAIELRRVDRLKKQAEKEIAIQKCLYDIREQNKRDIETNFL
jgi:hypothetical protein